MAVKVALIAMLFILRREAEGRRLKVKKRLSVERYGMLPKNMRDEVDETCKGPCPGGGVHVA